MKTKVTLLAFFATIAFYAQSQSNPGDLLPTNSPKTTNSGTPPKVDVPRIVDAPKVDVPRLNDADDDLLDVKSKLKTDDLLPLKSEKTGSSSTSRTDTTKDGVNSTLTIKNKGNQTTRPQPDKESIGDIKEKNNGTLINPSREKEDAPKDGFTKVKGNSTVTQPNTVNENTPGGIKPIRNSSNPNETQIKKSNENVKNENSPIKSSPTNATVTPKTPKDALGTKKTNEVLKDENKPSIDQVKDKSSKGKDLIKTINKTPKNETQQVEENDTNLPVGEAKVKDEKVKKD